MRTVNVNSRTITLGRQMENNATQVIFDLTPFIETWGDGTVTLYHKRHGDSGAYPVSNVERVDNTLVWTVAELDVTYSGNGAAELRWTVGDTKAKSIIYQTNVLESETSDIEIPSNLQSWYDTLIAYIDNHSIDESTIAQAITDYLDEHPIESAVASVNNQTGAVTLTASDVGAVSTSDLTTAVNSALADAKKSGEFDGADGQDGSNGQDGADGNGIASAVLNADYTLTLTFTDGTSYTTPSIRGAQGIQGIQGEQGVQGETGATGASGQNGVSVTHSWNGTVLTVTSASGTSSADLKGETGEVTLEDLNALATQVSELVEAYTNYLVIDKNKYVKYMFGKRAESYGSAELGAYWPSWATSTLSVGTRTKDAVNLVAYPSTDSEVARNDFDTYFAPIICNGHVESNGDFIVDYLEDEDGFSRTDADTYALFPPIYFKYDFTDGEEIDLCLSQKDGYAPVGPAIKSDGTVRDFIPIACYGMSLINGVPMSVSGADIKYNMSHNNNISAAAEKGAQYTMETAQENEFLNMLFLVTFATRDTQSIMKGCTSYNHQFNLVVAETGVKRVIVTNAQANNFIVGSVVSVGSGNNRNNTANNIVDRKPITSIEDLGNGNSAIYIDTDSTFDTATTNYITTMPWRSGATDGVLGSCGSPGSNSNGKYPYKFFGVECAWGQFIVLSNVVYKITAGIGKMYVTYDTANIKTSAPTADYSEVAYTVSGIGGNNGYISVMGYDANHPFVRFPIARDATPTTGYADSTFGMNNNKETTNSVREVIIGGALTYDVDAGRFCVHVTADPSGASWNFAARLSALGACGA